MKNNNDLKHFKVQLFVNGKSSEHKVKKNPFLVGRGENCDIIIESAEISRSHLKVLYKDKQLYVADTNSTNGTYYNKQAIETDTLIPIKQDIELKLGYEEEIFIQMECITKTESNAPIIEDENLENTQANGRDGIGNLIGALGKESLKSLKHYVKNSQQELEEAQKKAQVIVQEAKVEAEKKYTAIVSEAQAIREQTSEEAEQIIQESELQAKNTVNLAKTSAKKIRDEQLDGIVEAKKALAEDLAHLEAKKDIILSDISKDEKSIAQLKLEKSSMIKITEQHRDDMNEAEQNLSILQDQFKREQDSIEVELKRQNQNLSNIKDDYKDKVSLLENSEERVKDLQSSENDLTRSLDTLNNSIEKMNNEYDKLLADKNREQSRLDELYLRQENLQNSIESMNKSKQTELADLEQQKRNALDHIESIIAEAEEGIAHKQLQSETKIKEIIEETQMNAEDEADQIINKAKLDSENAHADGLQIKHEAQVDAEKKIQAASNEAKKIIEDAEKESGKIVSETSDYSYQLKKDFDAELNLQKQAFDAEMQEARKTFDDEITLYKLNKSRLVEEEVQRQMQSESNRMRAEKTELVNELNTLLITKLKKYLLDPENLTSISAIEYEIDKVTERVLLNVDYDEMDLAEYLKKDPLEQKKRTQRFWARTALGALGAIIIALVSPLIFDNIKDQAKEMNTDRQTASEIFVAKKIQEARNKPKFTPAKKQKYLQNYTDRVLYTENYVNKELDPTYREEWILKLNEFFVDKLDLDDNAIVPFIAQESNLIRELNTEVDKINVDYVDSGILRMREKESEFNKEIKRIVKSSSKFKKFLKFKEKFYSEH